MKQKIYLAVIVAVIVAIIGGIIMYSCQKDNLKLSTSEQSMNLKNGSVANSDETVMLSICEEILLKSQDAYNKDKKLFSSYCEQGNIWGVVALLNYSKEEWLELSRTLYEHGVRYAEKQGITFSEETKPCNSCSLENLPDVLKEIRIEKSASAGWMEALACFTACMEACMPTAVIPELYPICLATCTALCYYMSTSKPVIIR
jgi:hypothetical protein